MIFRPELARAVLDGRKTVTRRLTSDNPASPWWKERCAFGPGSVCAVQSGRGKPAIGRIRILAVELVQLGLISPDDAQREGFGDINEFRKAWAEINDGFDAQARVWRVEFELA